MSRLLPTQQANQAIQQAANKYNDLMGFAQIISVTYIEVMVKS
jgi:hypothetical protein